MGMGRYLFSSESVTEGHPDKIADRISDAILDAMIAQDPKSRVACETLVTTGLVVVAGEITSKAVVDIPHEVRGAIRSIGYTDAAMGFDSDTCGVIVTLDKQSADISIGVTEGEGLFKEQGAGDQGLMFGYASRETPELMPMAIQYAHQLTQRLTQARKEGILPWLRPDGKSQVTVEYANGMPTRVDTVVIAAQHEPDVTRQTIEEGIIEEVIKKVIPARCLDGDTRFLINATGRFVVGGPLGLWPHRPQDHRGHVWRLRRPWRGRLLRKRPIEGRSLCVVHGQTRGQEHCQGRSCRQMPSSGGLCHWLS